MNANITIYPWTIHPKWLIDGPELNGLHFAQPEVLKTVQLRWGMNISFINYSHDVCFVKGGQRLRSGIKAWWLDCVSVWVLEVFTTYYCSQSSTVQVREEQMFTENISCISFARKWGRLTTDAQEVQARKGALGIVSGVWGQYSVSGMSVTMPWTISSRHPDCAVPHCAL